MTSLNPQLLILGGLLLLVVAVVLYLLKALVNYRGALRRARESNDLATIPINDAREAQPYSSIEDVFATPPAGDLDVLGAPLRTGAWKPDHQVTPVSAYSELSSDTADVVDLSPELPVVPTEVSLSEPVVEPPDAPIPTVPSVSSTGSVLSAPGGLSLSVSRPLRDEPVSGASSDAISVSLTPVTAPVSADEPLEKAHEYVLVAPVELHFTASGSRVGVRQGTRTFLEFQRLSDILWDDLRSSGGSRRPR